MKNTFSVFLFLFLFLSASLHAATNGVRVAELSYKNLSQPVPAALTNYWKQHAKAISLSFTGCDFAGWLGSSLSLVAPGLRAFSAQNCTNLLAEDLSALSKAVDLESFSVLYFPFPAAAMETLASLPKLRHLSLIYTRLSDAELALIGRMTQLESLSLGKNLALTGKTLAALSGLRKLVTLRLWETRITDADLHLLAVFPVLQTLSVAKLIYTNLGWEALGKLTALENLDAGNNTVPSGALSNLARLSRLKQLNLAFCMFRGKGVEDNLASLAALPALRSLDLSYSDIGDEAVPALSLLGKLESLNVNNTKIGALAYSNLEAALPDTEIYY